MKKTTLSILFSLFSVWVFSQTLNQSANWPNSAWSLTGTYDATYVLATPTTVSSFSFNDDAAGSASVNDIAAVSPVIDLTTAYNAGETWIYFDLDYVFNTFGSEEFTIDYYNADTSSWVEFASLPDNSSATAAYCSSTSTSFTSEALNIAGFTATQLSGFKYRIYFQDNTTWGWGFCVTNPLIYSVTPPTCPDPSDLAEVSVTNNTITITWTENGSATKWNIQYGVSPLTLGTGTTTPTLVNPSTITGLTANTTYQIYVQANCGGGDYSNWIGPISVTTLCDPMIAPYTETFGSALPSCWLQGEDNAENWLFGTGTAATYHGPGTSPSGGYYAWVDDSTPSSLDTSLYTPLMDVSALTTPALIFYYNSDNGTLSNVSFSVDIFNGTTWTNDVYSSNADTSEWQYTVIDLSPYAASGIVQARFVVDETNGTDFQNDLTLDDVTFDELPTCFPIVSSAIGILTYNSAEITWVPMGTETSWVIEYGYTGFTPGTGTTINATSTSYTLTALDFGTEYEYYITSDCGNGDYGMAMGPFAFQTECVYPTPYTENFSNGGTIPDCWSQGADNSENWLFSNNPSGNHIGNAGTITGSTLSNGYYAWVDDSSPNSIGTTLKSPMFDISELTTPSLIFYKISNNEGYTSVDFSVDLFNGTTWVNDIYTSNTNTDGWEQVTIDLSPYTNGAPIQVRFVVDENNGTDFYDDIAIDDVIIGEMPTCNSPTTLTASNISVSSADIVWVENGSATVWNIEVVPAGSPQGTGTVVTVYTNPATIEGLTDATAYDVYVQSNCGTASSLWVGPLSFTTKCLPYGDFTDTFESYATSTVPDCWANLVSTTSTTAYARISTAYAHSGTKSFSLYNSGASTGDICAITPTLTDLPMGTHRAKFFARSSGSGYPLLVGTMSDPTNPATFTLVSTISLTTTFTQYIVDFPTPTTDSYVVLKHGLGGTYRTLYFDDFVWTSIPTAEPGCATNIVATPDASCGNFANTISWDLDGQADGYYISVGTSSGGTDVANNVNLGFTGSYSFTGEMNTTYYYTVTPYNNFGSATGCSEMSFTTVATGCYCTSVPTSNDNSGITNVTISGTSFTNPDVTYADYTATPVSATQSLTTPVSITFATGYTYDTNIWIDFNDNYTFEASEQVFDGVSLSTNPTILDATFTMPATATLGQHRMRIGTADTGQATPNPCYGGTYGVTLDFIVDIQPAPLTVPSSCPANVVATPDASCGNFDAHITWNQVSDAGGYYLTMGTTSGGNDVLDNMDLGGATSYTFATAINTTYYFTVTPYNGAGALTGCPEYSFSSAAAGCYCSSVPTSNDNLGITNVTINTTSFTNPDNTYANYTATPVTVAQGVTTSLTITFATGYTYDTNIWIDFNDNYIFETSEQVFDGTSLNANPTTFDASFVMPATATLGQHTMRIGTADTGQATPNPCYGGSYGVTLDFTVDIITASCTPASFTTAAIVPDCTSNTFTVDVNITGLGNGTPSITDGTTSWPVTATGVINVGPFSFGSPVSLVLLHGTDSVCDIPISTFNYTACPPANDECANAIALTVGANYAAYAQDGNLTAATSSGYTNTCAGSASLDTWYSVVVPADGNVTIQTGPDIANTTTSYDTGLEVYSGVCGSLSSVGCNDDGAGNLFSVVSLTGQTPGSTLYVRVWEYGGDNIAPFSISAYNTALKAESFESFNFTYYPNPVTNKLNLSSEMEITKVNVFNMLGQRVLTLTPNTNNYTVDMTQLASGSYFVEVNAGESAKTIKILKQ